MDTTRQNLEAIKDIRKIMERSSRFISLSGWSGISAGVCALAGAWVANTRLKEYYLNEYASAGRCPSCLKQDLMLIAAIVFVAAFSSAMLFTFIKSRKEQVAIWGTAARRLLWNTLLPMVTGAFILWRMMDLKQYELIAPGSLIFYGLALVNGSKYTMGEVRYLGYAEIITGIIGLWTLTSGLYIWALGFGILHIVYGLAMWWKYDRKETEKSF
jgi:hypothetical protein